MSSTSGVSGASSGAAMQDVASTTNRIANQDIFMQLLVAQLKYQNPMNPADGIEFMTQLTQFSQLEQTVSIRKEMESLTDMVSTMIGQASGRP
jgi:flagellar basal-body rod modification protein FlgD